MNAEEKNNKDKPILEETEEIEMDEEEVKEKKPSPYLNLSKEELIKKLDEVEQELEKATNERDEYLDVAQQVQSEMENYRKRSDIQRNKQIEYANMRLLKKFLKILDDVERSIEHATEEEEETSIHQGVTIIRENFKEMLKTEKIEEMKIKLKKTRVDPRYHEVVFSIPRDDMKPNTIIEVTEKGYKFKEEELRPAKVIVTTAVIVEEEEE
ncbi:MAG: nucleotide exchange factor GrpE [Candidatus Kariarchaeaceae archaeon]